MVLSSFVKYLESPPAFGSVVVGNNACDLDSVVCSLTRAYHLTCQGCPSTAILPIKTADLLLRTEVMYMLQLLKISTTMLHFTDSDLQFPDDVSLHLVDHNVYKPGTIPNLTSYTVESIIDHHVDEGGPATSKTVKMVGSCATLITEIMTSDPTFYIPPDLKTALAGTILLDTINLDFEQGRTTRLDFDMFEKVDTPREFDLYRDLIEAKTDISSLDAFDLLRRDYKMFTSREGSLVCVASITGANWEQYYSLPDLEALTEKFISQFNVSVLVIMLAYHEPNGAFSRYLVLGRGSSVIDVNELRNALQLDQIITRDARVFNQRNLKASRKVVLPLIKAQLT